MFWADQLAEQIIERAEREGNTKPNIKCQQTPSGAKHIGNLNDVIRCYFPYKVLLEHDVQATFVHTTDDRDPLKDVPAKLAALDGSWHASSELIEMRPCLGRPVCNIPGPFGCCSSWSKHFTTVWMDGVHALGMKPTLYSVDELYKKGAFDPYIKMVFEKKERVGRLVAKFQQTKGETYIPFDAMCPQCGTLTNVNAFDLKKKIVSFVCTGKEIKQKKTEGCGFAGSVPWTEGKLQWRFEWPALWAIFNTTYEPFGKDHAEGSWPAGQQIARDIFEIEPPIPYVYEFFLVNGEKMSASKGNVYIVQDMLNVVEPEVFMFFYTKRPGKQRDLDLKNIHLLVDQFERAERIFYGAEEEKNKAEEANLKRSYEMCCTPPSKMPIRVPYQFAAYIAQVTKPEEGLGRALELLKFTGHVQRKITKENEEQIKDRLMVARSWAEQFAAERYKIKLRDTPTPIKLEPGERSAVEQLSEELSQQLTEKSMQARIYEIAKENEIEPRRLFQICYTILLGRNTGPRLGPFITIIGKDKVRKTLSMALER